MESTHRQGQAPTGIRIGGTAAVYCVHDRQQRQITEEAQVLALAPPGAKLDGDHKITECQCCHNLFVTDSPIDEKCLPCDPARQRLLSQAAGGIFPLRGVDA